MLIAVVDSDELRTWMAARGYTVRGLARALGVERKTVQRWLSGATPISRTVELALRGLERE